MTTTRVIHLELSIVAQEVSGCADEQLETAILLAAQQAAAKYIVGGKRTVVLVRERRAGDPGPAPAPVRRSPLPFVRSPQRN